MNYCNHNYPRKSCCSGCPGSGVFIQGSQGEVGPQGPQGEVGPVSYTHLTGSTLACYSVSVATIISETYCLSRWVNLPCVDWPI